MKLTYTNQTGKLTLETEAASPAAAFETLAQFNEVFDEPGCGNCASVNIRFDVRRAQSYKYFNLICRDCGCRLDVGQCKDMVNLFIDRKDDAGNPLPNDGWYKYQPETGNPPPASPLTAPAPRPALPAANSTLFDLYRNKITAAIRLSTLQHVGNEIAAEKGLTPGECASLRTVYELQIGVVGVTTNEHGQSTQAGAKPPAKGKGR